ncbi:MAG: S1 RNA-binding domain-containing protein [Bacillota bacterium]|jgi:S1 RNA binding domain protein
MGFNVGDIIEGKITGITKFGAFVEIQKGVTGLVHISEIANTYVENVADFFKEQDLVKVKIINIGDNGKIALSIKQVVEQKPQERPAKTRMVNRSSFEDRADSSSESNPFEDKLAKFMKDSNEKLLALKRHQDGRKGRYGR